MQRTAAFSLFFACLAGPALAHETLPLGDGKISSFAKAGNVYSCQTQFDGGRGAFRDGPWITGTTWSPDDKLYVTGNVSWPNAFISIKTNGEYRLIGGNGLPSFATGTFPIAQNDPAYQYDRNPNSILSQQILLRLPANPQPAATPTCVGMGMIGMTLTGAALFNALDGEGRDAVAHEIQDHCNGHPEPRGQYHFHGWSDCIGDASGKSGKHSDLAGYALDGFGIFGPIGESGKLLTNGDLDECHGHTHAIQWDGKTVTMYHYHFTHEYPYSVGCYRGTPLEQRMSRPSHMQRPFPPYGGFRPPPPPNGFPPPPPPR